METLIVYSFLGLAAFIWSPMGRALADRIKTDGDRSKASDLIYLEHRVAEVERFLTENRKETYELKEKLTFYESLQAPQSQNSPND